MKPQSPNVQALEYPNIYFFPVAKEETVFTAFLITPPLGLLSVKLFS